MAFDPAAATAAYIDSLGPEALARAAAYTAGNHWLTLWNLVATVVVTWIIVRLGVLDRLDARLTRRSAAARIFVVGFVYFVLSALINLPWSIYADWWRELSYGRTSQPLGDWLVQGLIAIVVFGVVAAAFFIGVYALLHRAGRFWWAWTGAITAAGMSVFLLLSPLVIEPLFNDYRPLPEGAVKAAIVEQAQRAGIPTERIYQYDGSRQSNNFTANAGGVGPSSRIAISDVAFKGASLDEVKAVTGHEIGHWVLGHLWQAVLVYSLLAMVGAFAVDRLHAPIARALGSRAELRSPASLPVLVLIGSVVVALGQPLTNTESRHAESAADRYSLETVNLPDALSSALVKTAEYRYPRPSALQEVLFYTHPSVERRVRAAMEWKAAHPPAGAD